MADITLPVVDFRVYIGPYHTHYDWSAHTLSTAFSSAFYTPTTTTGQVSGATTLAIASATGFGTVGGVWVAPNDSPQAWEYEQFTARTLTTLTVVRESTTDREHNGVHTSGAPVYQFYPVTSNDGILNITDEIDETLSAVTWRATISGVKAPQHVLRNGHIVIVTTSIDAGATYQIAILGFVDNPTMTDDKRSAAEWTLNIISSAQLVAEVQAAGVRIGTADLANAGSASSVQELILPYDERSSGDFTAASPDLSAASAIDGDLKTLWIAEHYTGTDIFVGGVQMSVPENEYNLRFSHLYLNPPTAAGAGARFIELAVTFPLQVVGYALNSANGNIGPNGCEIWIFKGPGDLVTRDRIFLVEDAEVFSRLNPLAQSAAIYENRTFFSHILATGGEFWLRVGAINSWQARVRWGTGNSFVQHPNAPARTWTGSTVTAPTIGQTMRYLYNVITGDASTRWNTSMVRHAGYNIDNDDPMWIMVTLPGLGLTLAQDITATVPGNSGFLYLNGPDEKYSTDGLPTSGTLFIGDEKIAYSSKTVSYVVLASIGARGASGTTAAKHDAGDEVYLMDGTVYTDAYLIGSIGWSRSGGTIYPASFNVYTSNLVDMPRTPDQAGYTLDWTTQANVTLHSTSTWTGTLTTVRVKHLLIEILKMTVDPARPRLNEIHAKVNSSLHNPALWLAAGTTAGALIQQILLTTGIPAGAISHTGTAALAEAVTADDNAWTVVVDVAEYSGSRITVMRDSKFVIAVDPFWTSTPSATATWDRATASSVQKSFRKVTPVSQVILPWKTADGVTTGKVYYPVIAGRGSKLEQPETVYASEAAATSAARRLYFMRLYPFEAVVVDAAVADGRKAGDIHTIQWRFFDETQLIDRNYVVMSADHSLTEGSWKSTFRLVQYGHESNF